MIHKKEEKFWSSIELKYAFEAQIEKLKERKIPTEIVESLKTKHRQVILAARDMQVSIDNTPFVPIIPATMMETWQLLEHARFGLTLKSEGKKGQTRLDFYSMVDSFVPPKESPYFLLNVDINEGQNFMPQPLTPEITMPRPWSFYLTVTEAICLAIQDDCLVTSLPLSALGTRCAAFQDVAPRLVNYPWTNVVWGPVKEPFDRVSTPTATYRLTDFKTTRITV